MCKGKILIVCTTDSMIWNFLVPHIKNLETDGYIVECACSITGDFFNNLIEKYGLKMHEVNFSRNPYRLNNINAYFKLKSIVKKRQIKLIFCHEPVGGALGRLVGHSLGCKVVYMAHGFHFYKGAPKIARVYYYVEKWLSKYTDDLITINKEDYNASLLFKAKRNHLIPGIGIDTSKYKYEPNHDYLCKILNLNKESILLLSIGELIPRKNHEIVIDAVTSLDNNNIHYVIVGDGELENHLKEKVKDLSIDNVHFLGYRNDINRLCNSADIFIMPSLQEGLSVALMEAMACGLPIIASNIRGNNDLISDSKYGILVNSTDLEGYACAINYLANDPIKRKQMGSNNIVHIKSFNIEKVKKMLLSIINVAYRE